MQAVLSLTESPVGRLWSDYCTDSTVSGRRVRITTVEDEHSASLWVEDSHDLHAAEAAVALARVKHDDLKHLEYAVSHDLMEPLRGITSSLTAIETVYGRSLPEGSREMFDHAVGASRTMTNLLKDFLRYVRLDTDQRVPDQTVDLNTIMRDVLQSLKLLVDDTDAVILANQLPTVRGDWRMLYQVFSNLLSNGIKFSGSTPRIAVTSVETPDAHVLSFADEGLGMPPERIDTVFTPFIRLHKSVPGSGLGLAIVKRCVEMHRGTITVQSTLGKGTNFIVTLPKDCGQAACV